VSRFEEKIRQRLGAAIYATGQATLESVVAGLLAERGTTLAVAETLTMGDLTRRLSAHPDVLRGGVVAAEAQSLGHLLGVEDKDLDGEAGSASALASALAQAVRGAWGTGYGLAVIGDEKERAWVAVAGNLAGEAADVRRLRWQGRDRRARTWTTTVSLEFLRRLLLGLAGGWAA
jgi:nicotinamide mononucleotide (NMN) deamidase PncC